MKVIQWIKKWGVVFSLAASVVSFSSCSAPSQSYDNTPSNSLSAPSAESNIPWSDPSVKNIITGGNRVGGKAISRDSINSYLNNPKPRRRPGLGTTWGGQVSSKVDFQSYQRASKKPKAVSMIYYNDKQGVRAMSGASPYKTKGLQRAANGLVEWGVKGRTGYLKNVHGKSRRFVEGKKDSSYSLVVKNVCHSRLEVVLSVDGLSVMDGVEASVKQRGYIIDPGRTLVVKGFRTSVDAVAAFKFSTVDQSYANQLHGKSRNVGVIGMAVFTEKGVDPWKWSRPALDRRMTAKAFAEAPSMRAR